MKIDLDWKKKLRIFTNRKFYPLYWNENRYMVLGGGAGSGKSEYLAGYWIKRCMDEPGHRVLLVRRYKNSLQESVIQTIKDKMEQLGVSEYWKINKTEITCANGSCFLWAGMDDAQKLKSIRRITGVWIEEASEISQEDFVHGIDTRLRGKTPGPKVISLSFNPVSAQHWLKAFFYDRSVEDACLHHSTYRDNWWCDQEYKRVIESLKETNPTLYKVYGLGEWGVLKGLIYPDNWTVESTWPNKFEDEFYGVDFGYNNPTTLYKIGMIDGEPWIEEVLYRSEMTDSDLLTAIENRNVSNKLPMYGDSEAPDKIGFLKRSGYNCKPAVKGKGSVFAGITFCQGLQWHLHPNRHENIKNELGVYSWALDKDGNPKDEPVKFMDHGVDAIRYGLWTHIGIKRGKRKSRITKLSDW